MKAMSVRGLRKTVKECVADAHADRVVITCHRRPVAVLVGGEGRAWEAVRREADPAFWWTLIPSRERR